jgi:hypothetical protein
MIDLDVPETVATPFVVATDRPPHDPRTVARTRVRHRSAADLLDTSLIQITTVPVGDSGYTGLIDAAAWARPSDRSMLRKFTHHVVVMGHIPPVSQPDHGQATRAIARALAEACDGIVYDAWSNQVLPHDFRYGAEHPEFCLADDWLATFITGRPDDALRLEAPYAARIGALSGDPGKNRAPGGVGESDAVGGGPGESAAPGGRLRDNGGPEGGLRVGGRLDLTTAGLHRFALPELEAHAVPLGNVFAAVTLLRCLSVVLLSEHWDWLACNPGAHTRRLPPTATVESRDVWRYWAAEPRPTADGRVHVRLTKSGELGPQALPYVSVGPPADFPAAAGEWWNDVVDLAMPYVPQAPRRTAA